MASLRSVVNEYREELRDGIAEVVFWKEGKGWNAASFWLDTNDNFEADDLAELNDILSKDPSAIVVNGYTDCPFTNEGSCSVDFMVGHIVHRYGTGGFLLADFIIDHTPADEDSVEDSVWMSEDKQVICDLLLPVLQNTRNLHDVVDLKYHAAEEVVIATFSSGYSKKANVAVDSGTSMIRDIIGQIV